MTFISCSRPFFSHTFTLLCLLCSTLGSFAQISNLSVRAMAANITSGNNQSYETPGINIFKALKPDIVAIQEFRYNSSTSASNLRAFVDEAFGTNFHYYCEPSGNIPNGIVSRWPIGPAGSWNDVLLNDRGFAWAQINIPGTNPLFVVSLHLYSSGSATDRNNEALAVKSNIVAELPSNAWILVGGDFNTDSRSEAAVTTFKTFLSDSPIPVDNAGDPDTNAGRNKPYDYLLPSFSMTNYLTPVVLPSHSFPNGLVFDSRVYTPLTDVPPVQSGDSGAFQMQHMAVIKNFLLPIYPTNSTPTAPNITAEPQSQTVSEGSPVNFSVIASGTAPLSYQWRFNATNISNATNSSYAIASAQSSNAGPYTVIITNAVGAVTSAPAILTVNTTTNTPTGTNVMISQIYGGGGNTGGTYLNDFVELFNPTATAVSLTNWTVQYASVTGSSWSQATLSGTIQPYRYYLVQLGSGGANGVALPTPEATGGANISATQGKLALVRTNIALSGASPLPNPLIADFVGYGSTASAFEGSGPYLAASGNTNSILRKSGGLTDTDDNANDFITLSPPAPRNSASAANPPANPPAMAPTLTNLTFSASQIIFQVTGTAASNYVVQASTNLATTNWMNVQTNAAPFWFTNPATDSQRYFRGTVTP